MNEGHAMGFFIINVILVVTIFVCFGTVKFISDYREKKAKERRELEEAAKMFEQRIALKPKHIGSRIGMGIAADVSFEKKDQLNETH